ncbi:hypothetical protein ACIQUF_10355 [Pseudomonas sp. NPDC090233]|uniref:hypothetical protein n=1 Tax=Pseudomonas sp. NPDC090233 TaxID=3364479 RepID=UPI00383BA200
MGNIKPLAQVQSGHAVPTNTSQNDSSAMRNAEGVVSLPLTFRVTRLNLTLPPPVVRNTPDNTLTPVEGQVVLVDIAYEHMGTSHEIELVWNGRIYTAVRGEVGGTVSVVVERADIIASIGRTVQVFYYVTRDGRRETSDTLQLQVTAPTFDPILHAPVILEAVSGQLDVSALLQDARLTVARWPFKEEGQLLYLSFSGTLQAGTPYEAQHAIWWGYPASNANLEQTEVELIELRKLKADSDLHVRLEVSFDGGVSKIPFPLSTYRVIQVLLEERFEGLPEDVLKEKIYAVGAKITVPSMVIEMIYNQDVANAYAAIEKDPNSTMALLVNRSPHGGVTPNRRMVLRLTLNHEYSKVKLTWLAAHAVGYVRFLDVNGNELEVGVAVANNAVQVLSSRLHGPNKIKALQIEVTDVIYLDDFIFTR